MKEDRLNKIYNLLDVAIVEAKKTSFLDLHSVTSEAKVAHLRLVEAVEACAEKQCSLDEVKAKFQLWIAEIQAEEGICINCNGSIAFVKGKAMCGSCGVFICVLNNSSEEKKSAPIKPKANLLEFPKNEPNLFSNLKA
jgi:hypothetical protein